MSTPSNVEIVEALTAALLAHAPLTALVSTRIYTSPPQDIPMPFVRFRWDQANEWDTKDSQGWEGFVTFDIYTNLQGDKQSLAIADVLDNLLTPSFILPLTSCQHLYTRHDSRNTYTQQDGALIHHTVMRYRMIFTL